MRDRMSTSGNNYLYEDRSTTEKRPTTISQLTIISHRSILNFQEQKIIILELQI